MLVRRDIVKPIQFGRTSEHRWLQRLRKMDVSRTALVYLAAVGMAELITAVVSPTWGVACHIFIFGNLLIQAGMNRRPWERGFYLSMSIAPLIRIVSMGMPLGYFRQEWWYLLSSIPLFATSFVIARTIPLNRREINLQMPDLRHLPLSLLVALSGIPLGAIEFVILRPTPIVSSLDWRKVTIASLILLIGTGFIEELIFRGILQTTVSELYNSWWAIVYVSVLFGELHTGHMSVVDVFFVIGVALYFAAVVKSTRSLLGVSLAHGLTNIFLFIVFPLTHFL